MSAAAVDDIELPLLLQAIWGRWGYDFRDYARAPMQRVLANVQARHGIATLSMLQHRVLHDPAFFETLLPELVLSVSDLFREPASLRRLCEEARPWLRTFARIKVWHAGCAAGQEVYSLAILLEECGLLGRTLAYGTDINPQALAAAREAIYPERDIRDRAAAYHEAGGIERIDRYFAFSSGLGQVREAIREHAMFADHNLVTDGPVAHVQVVLCRNTLMYFDEDLRDRAIDVFWAALEPGGFLCLGEREGLMPDRRHHGFERLPGARALYRKRAS